jgi:signal transduction histidine kinase
LWEADAQRLKQALMIVLDNAIKYSPSGRSVLVRLWLCAADGIAEIVVRDEGAGVPPEELPHVFERFYRGPSAASRSGSGLGLDIAKWLVEKHGGEIALTSEAGCFTEVRIRIPRVEVSLAESSARRG